MNTELRRGTYVGPIRALKGRTALLRGEASAPHVQAQFDDLGLHLGRQLLAYGWHGFPRQDFEVEEAYD